MIKRHGTSQLWTFPGTATIHLRMDYMVRKTTSHELSNLIAMLERFHNFRVNTNAGAVHRKLRLEDYGIM